MELWRISNYSDLSGAGGFRFGGRWHSEGRRIVYLADHPSSALLETLVHLDRNSIPATYQLLRIQVTEGTLVEEVDISTLPVDWRDRLDLTCQIGDAWLDGHSSPLLRIPSAVSARASNYLLNPVHAATSDIHIVETIIAPLDFRLLKGS